MLDVKNISVYYDKVCALSNISFHVDEGEIVSVIGANGAGKTTLMSSITGLVHAASGTITFDGRDITKMQPHKIVRHGITYVPEGRLIFPELTEERRKDLAKDVKKKGEGAKVAVRNIRRDANDLLKKLEKGGEITEDELADGEDQIQKLTDKMIAKVDKAVEEKTAEIMTV